MMRTHLLLLPLLILIAMPGAAAASEAEAPLKHAKVSMDHDTLRRGLQVFTDTCMGCHSAKYVTYRDLMDYPELALTRGEVDDLRGDHPLLSGMLTDLTPEDAKVSYGKVPPDLSVISRSRAGPDYIYSILTGFAHDPEGRIPDGHYNIYFPGHNIAMPDPLLWFNHDPQDEKEIEQQAQDVASFLTFIGEPHQLQRKRIGIWVLGFLILLTLVLYALKREVWKDVRH